VYPEAVDANGLACLGRESFRSALILESCLQTSRYSCGLLRSHATWKQYHDGEFLSWDSRNWPMWGGFGVLEKARLGGLSRLLGRTSGTSLLEIQQTLAFGLGTRNDSPVWLTTTSVQGHKKRRARGTVHGEKPLDNAAGKAQPPPSAIFVAPSIWHPGPKRLF
jgi:hypothetical protein